MVTYHTLAALLTLPHTQMRIGRNVGLFEGDSNPQKFIHYSSITHRRKSIKSLYRSTLRDSLLRVGSSPGTIGTGANNCCQIKLFNANRAVFTALGFSCNC